MKVFLAFAHAFPLLWYHSLLFLNHLSFLDQSVSLWLISVPFACLPLFRRRYLLDRFSAFINLHSIEHLLLSSSLSLVIFWVLAPESLFVLLFWFRWLVNCMRLCWLFFRVLLDFGWLDVLGRVLWLCELRCLDTLCWALSINLVFTLLRLSFLIF